MNNLEMYVTNTKGSVFALQNLSEVVKGALFSRYSRSVRGLRELLVDEFINHEDEGAESAEQFYDRVLDGYGDDSIAEQGGVHIACEGISNIAAKALEDCRVGMSFIEKSSRYVKFGRRADGTYPYYRDSSIVSFGYKDLYENALDNLFDQYNNMMDAIAPHLLKWYPRDFSTSDRAYQATIKAKKLDLLRGLLPLATLTNVGVYGNGLAFRNLLVKLYASDFNENRELAYLLQTELEKIILSFVKQVSTDRGTQAIWYLKDKRQKTREMVGWLTKKYEAKRTPEMKVLLAGEFGIITASKYDTSPPNVLLVHYDPQAEEKIASAIIFSESHVDVEQSIQIAWAMSMGEKMSLFRSYAGDRKNRRNLPGRAFEEIFYTFEICADIGAYRDMQRHRMLTQERQDFTVMHGFILPPELEDAGVASQYKEALERASECYEKISGELAVQAQYVVPFAYRVRWKVKLNLREAFHIIELRSQIQGHPSYRAIALGMFSQIKKIHPCFADLITWVDLNDYDLSRLASEQKRDTKR